MGFLSFVVNLDKKGKRIAIELFVCVEIQIPPAINHDHNGGWLGRKKEEKRVFSFV